MKRIEGKKVLSKVMIYVRLFKPNSNMGFKQRSKDSCRWIKRRFSSCVSDSAILVLAGVLTDTKFLTSYVSYDVNWVLEEGAEFRLELLCDKRTSRATLRKANTLEKISFACDIGS